MDALAFAASEGLAPVGDEAQPSLDRLLLLLLKARGWLEFSCYLNPQLRINYQKESSWLMFSFLPQCTGSIAERSGWHLGESLSLQG
jgi:hypothetical protein